MYLPGSSFPGHTRYSTSGCSEAINCQPFIVETLHGRIAVAHNGELVNAAPLKHKVPVVVGGRLHMCSINRR